MRCLLKTVGCPIPNKTKRHFDTNRGTFINNKKNFNFGKKPTYCYMKVLIRVKQSKKKRFRRKKKKMLRVEGSPDSTDTAVKTVLDFVETNNFLF